MHKVNLHGEHNVIIVYYIFYRSFDGYATQEKNTENLAILSEALERDDLKFVTGRYVTAGYDAPYKFWDRHNEVWIFADE